MSPPEIASESTVSTTEPEMLARPRRWPTMLALILALLLGAAGLTVGVIGLRKANSATSELAQVQKSISGLGRNLNAVTSDLSDVTSSLDSVTGDIKSMQSALDSVAGQSGDIASIGDFLVSLDSDVSDLNDAVFGFGGLVSSVEDLTNCVNKYMRTVGNAAGGYYTYYFC